MPALAGDRGRAGVDVAFDAFVNDHCRSAPKGVFNLLIGRGSVTGQRILEHKNIDAITFTGSVATGRKVAAACAERMRKFQLEMGGKNPLVVR